MSSRKVAILVEEDLLNELIQFKKVGVPWSKIIRTIWEENKNLKAKLDENER